MAARALALGAFALALICGKETRGALRAGFAVEETHPRRARSFPYLVPLSRPLSRHLVRHLVPACLFLFYSTQACLPRTFTAAR